MEGEVVVERMQISSCVDSCSRHRHYWIDVYMNLSDPTNLVGSVKSALDWLNHTLTCQYLVSEKKPMPHACVVWTSFRHFITHDEAGFGAVSKVAMCAAAQACHG